MIWLASFPRSGNTFFRIVLDRVYGIESSTLHHESAYPIDANYSKYAVVKTHLLPDELVPADPSIPAVYLVRDGRDCVVSLAHYRQQLIAEDSDFETNLAEAIDAEGGSNFGGWGEHVRRWLPRASLVLRFEDLIADPIACLEQLRAWVDLPEPRVDRLPSFGDLQTRDFKYGSGKEHGFDDDERRRWRTGKFRHGRAGAWRDEMPERLHLRFLRHFGSELKVLNYLGDAAPAVEKAVSLPFDATPGKGVTVRGYELPAGGKKTPRSRQKIAPRSHRNQPRPYRVLIDAAKLLDSRIDGIRRYVHELLRALRPLTQASPEQWDIDVGFGWAGTIPLVEMCEEIEVPRKMIPDLLQPENPIQDSKERLEALQSQFGMRVISETVRYNALKIRRSAQKRLLESRKLATRATKWMRSDANTAHYDLMHLTLPNTWLDYQDVSAPRLMTVHDLSHMVCPEHQERSSYRSLTAGMRHAEESAADYIAVSNSTRDQMVQLQHIDPALIRVVYEACDKNRFQPTFGSEELHRVQQKYKLPEGRYLLSLGTIEPRKNLLNTVRAFQMLSEQNPELGAELVIAGGFGWGDLDEFRSLIDSNPRVHAVGYVADEDLSALYSGAAAFTYVSFYEGFGLPLVEAMACGVPTIYGDNSSMPEIVQGAGLGVPSEDVPQIARKMGQLLSDESLQQDLARQAVLRSLDFSWQHAAEETLDCYEHFIERRRAAQQNAVQKGSPRRRRNAS